MKESNLRIGQEFNPAPQLKTLYYLYLVLGVIFGVLPWYLPVLLLLPLVFSGAGSVLVLCVVGFVGYWINKYYGTIKYRLTEDEIMWRRGVWFQKTGIVPYNRITNVDISQGPISRKLGIASLKIQTAGYSAPSGTGGMSELRLDGIEQFEELQETIMEYVRGRKPVATETYEGEDTQIIKELVKIRTLLEKVGKE